MTYKRPLERRDEAWATANAISTDEPDTEHVSALIVQWRLLAELADLNDNLENIANALDRMAQRHER